ncbi:MAG TPA: NAD(P)/FAD-dependent oxidoreductase [Lacunisphaera sp.]|jgi:NADH dehydrogenase|nr:NAD(P)/FAD-dependent oxidoreductase [Lacunisphaera sp.]
MKANSTRLPHVVVLGAGFGGLTFAQKFPSHLARVTVVDRQNHHVFQPLLYQVATAGLSAPDIAQPIRSILRRQPNLTVAMAEVRGIDLGARRVHLDTGDLDYEWLLIALGGQTSYFGHPEWEQFAPGLKSLDDAVLLRRNMLMAYERAELAADPARRRQLMTTVVVGGGPTGVELAGSFAELARTVLYRDFDHIDSRQARILLVEGGPRVLGTFPEKLSARAKDQLEHLGVEVRLNTRVTAVRAGEVELDGVPLPAGNIVWAAGVGASRVTRSLGVETDRAGRIKVRPDLSLPGHSEVFAIGDLAVLQDVNGVEVPGVAQGAIQGAAHVARLMAYDISVGRRTPEWREPFAYDDKGSLATIGRSAAVAQVGRLHLSGLLAWLAWLGLHLVLLMGFRNRVSVFINWVYSYFAFRRGARIITGRDLGPPDRTAPSGEQSNRSRRAGAGAARQPPAVTVK